MARQNKRGDILAQNPIQTATSYTNAFVRFDYFLRCVVSDGIERLKQGQRVIFLGHLKLPSVAKNSDSTSFVNLTIEIMGDCGGLHKNTLTRSSY